jgi:hypothetical protein
VGRAVARVTAGAPDWYRAGGVRQLGYSATRRPVHDRRPLSDPRVLIVRATSLVRRVLWCGSPIGWVPEVYQVFWAGMAASEFIKPLATAPPRWIEDGEAARIVAVGIFHESSRG